MALFCPLFPYGFRLFVVAVVVKKVLSRKVLFAPAERGFILRIVA